MFIHINCEEITIHPQTIEFHAWAQFGGGRVSLTFSDGGNIICHVPHFFSLGFAFREVSKIK